MQKHPIDSAIKKKLDSFEMSPNDSMWESIDQQINKQVWLKRMVYFTGTLIVLGVLSSLWFNKNNNIHKETIDSVNVEHIDSTTLLNKIEEKETKKRVEKITVRSSSNTRPNPHQTSTLIPSSIVTTPENKTAPDTFSISNSPLKKTSDSISSTPKVVVIKKKKPVYIIQQDTIVKTDTIQVKKREK